MPSKPADYHPKWTLIKRLIHRRAGGYCEHCGLKQHSHIFRLKTKRGKTRMVALGQYRYLTDEEEATLRRLSALPKPGSSRQRGKRWARKYMGVTFVALEVAHLDHSRANNRFGNLAALCQSCHQKHDKAQHVRSTLLGRHHDNEQQTKLFN